MMHRRESCYIGISRNSPWAVQGTCVGLLLVSLPRFWWLLAVPPVLEYCE